MTRSRRAVTVRTAAMRAVLALAAVVRTAVAQSGTPCPAPVDDGRGWAPPLDRVATQPASGVALRTALDQLAARAGVRLSYSSEVLPLDREACTIAVAAPLGSVLRALLHGVAVTPVPASATQVVLAPARTVPPLAARTATLDRVVVTGSAAGAPQRALPYAIDVVSPSEVRAAAAPTLAQALDGAVPGLWIWNDAPTALYARYASVRGASSFGVSAPKVFVDGIELANPLLLTRLAGEAVDRVEVIRGPQGAALHGADAISGVIHVQLRHDGAADGRREATVRSSAGSAASAFANGSAFTQEHLLALRAGSTGRSAGAVVALNTIGGVVPGGEALQFSVDASARSVGARRVTSAIASVRTARAETPINPLIVDSVLAPASPFAANEGRRALTHYTVGSTTTLTPGATWTHQVTAGLDGYRLSGFAMDIVPVPSAIDSALRATQGGADRASLRATSVRRAAFGDALTGNITIAGDAALLRDATTSAGPARLGNALRPGLASSVRWLGTVGVGVQAGLAWRETFFVSAGLRGERNDGFTNASRFAALPALGASMVRTHGPLTWKLRVAYGEGVRPARTPMREAAWQGWRLGAVAADLEPERQAGVESGLDLFWGRTFALQLTRFDQRASSLIQQVPVALQDTPPPTPRPSMPTRRLAWQLENVGAITNRGWELGARVAHGAIALQGTVALVQSRVEQVAPTYTGDLRAGDRMLNVPARTAGLSLTWQPRGWQLQGGVTHVADWIGYDRLGVARDVVDGGAPGRSLTGDALRAYWLRYGGVTRVRAAIVRDLRTGLTLRLTGDNLLGTQRGEPDNTTIVPGRTIGLGIGARF